ncbi:MAG: hypothetical protein CMJ78_26320 [Planctomycetaceae bacterium]|nr:hypothetical protein [Planctomycetaceae bacterium]
MQRFHQVLFTESLLALCWLCMMIVHELGHVIGAVLTGGHVERVVLHPLAISRTDVLPNPHPGVVVWLGPVLGCLLPWLLMMAIPKRTDFARSCAQFFAGFCMLANGAYIGLGSFDAIGDCREMRMTGTPQLALMAFGVPMMAAGFFLWHQLGKLSDFIAQPDSVRPRAAYLMLAILLLVIAVEITTG